MHDARRGHSSTTTLFHNPISTKIFPTHQNFSTRLVWGIRISPPHAARPTGSRVQFLPRMGPPRRKRDHLYSPLGRSAARYGHRSSARAGQRGPRPDTRADQRIGRESVPIRLVRERTMCPMVNKQCGGCDRLGLIPATSEIPGRRRVRRRADGLSHGGGDVALWPGDD